MNIQNIINIFLWFIAALIGLRFLIWFIPIVLPFLYQVLLFFAVILYLFAMSLPIAEQYDELVNNRTTNKKLDEIAKLMKKDNDDDFMNRFR